MPDELETEEMTKTVITINDFAIVVNIIDECTKRGAFRGEELTVVGNLRDKFVNFVNENQPKKPVEPTPQV